MPTYEYACDACGHRFEEFQSIKAKPLIVCPKCKKRKLRRLISAGAGFIFKGSGFYTTDYRSEAYKADAKNDSGAPQTDVKTETKTDHKSETKSDAARPAAKSEAAPANSDTKAKPPAASKK